MTGVRSRRETRKPASEEIPLETKGHCKIPVSRINGKNITLATAPKKG